MIENGLYPIVRRVTEPNRNALFIEDLKTAIRATITSLKRSGTVSMSADNLWQLVAGKLPKGNGPTGTNAAFIARSIFIETIDDNKSFRDFVI